MGRKKSKGGRARNERVTVACAVCGTEQRVRASIASEYDYLMCYTHEDISDFMDSVTDTLDKKCEFYFLQREVATNFFIGCTLIPDPDRMMARNQELLQSQNERADDALIRYSAEMIKGGYSPWEDWDEDDWKNTAYAHEYGVWDPHRKPSIPDVWFDLSLTGTEILEAILDTGHPQRGRILTFSAEVEDNPGHIIGGDVDVVSKGYVGRKIDRRTHFTHEYETDKGNVFLLSGDFEDYADILACGQFGWAGVTVREFLEDEEKDPVTGLPWKTVAGYAFGPPGLKYLTEAEMFDNYCTMPDDGDMIPPEPAVRYIASPPLDLSEELMWDDEYAEEYYNENDEDDEDDE